MASQINRLLKVLSMPTTAKAIRVGSHPADWATIGRVTMPGPVMLEIRRARPPQKEMSLIGSGSKRTFWKLEI